MFHLFYDVNDNCYFIMRFVKDGYLWSGWIHNDFSIPATSYSLEKTNTNTLQKFKNDYNFKTYNYKKLGSFRTLTRLQKYVIDHPELFI